MVQLGFEPMLLIAILYHLCSLVLCTFHGYLCLPPTSPCLAPVLISEPLPSVSSWNSLLPLPLAKLKSITLNFQGASQKSSCNFPTALLVHSHGQGQYVGFPVQSRPSVLPRMALDKNELENVQKDDLFELQGE